MEKKCEIYYLGHYINFFSSNEAIYYISKINRFTIFITKYVCFEMQNEQYSIHYITFRMHLKTTKKLMQILDWQPLQLNQNGPVNKYQVKDKISSI